MDVENYRKLILSFMKRVNCACNRIYGMNKMLLCNGSGIITELDARISAKNKRWTIVSDTVNPLGLLLVGMPYRPYEIYRDLRLPYGTNSPFIQGFMVNKDYKDVWGGFNKQEGTPYYDSSLMFNIGRKFIKKYGVTASFSLTANLPNFYQNVFENLL